MKRGYMFCEKCGREVHKKFVYKLWIDGKFIHYCLKCKRDLLYGERILRRGFGI